MAQGHRRRGGPHHRRRAFRIAPRHQPVRGFPPLQHCCRAGVDSADVRRIQHRRRGCRSRDDHRVAHRQRCDDRAGSRDGPHGPDREHQPRARDQSSTEQGARRGKQPARQCCRRIDGTRGRQRARTGVHQPREFGVPCRVLHRARTRCPPGKRHPPRHVDDPVGAAGPGRRVLRTGCRHRRCSPDVDERTRRRRSADVDPAGNRRVQPQHCRHEFARRARRGTGQSPQLDGESGQHQRRHRSAAQLDLHQPHGLHRGSPRLRHPHRRPPRQPCQRSSHRSTQERHRNCDRAGRRAGPGRDGRLLDRAPASPPPKRHTSCRRAKPARGHRRHQGRRRNRYGVTPSGQRSLEGRNRRGRPRRRHHERGCAAARR